MRFSVHQLYYLSKYFHAVPAQHHTAPNLWSPIDGNATLKEFPYRTAGHAAHRSLTFGILLLQEPWQRPPSRPRARNRRPVDGYRYIPVETVFPLEDGKRVRACFAWQCTASQSHLSYLLA